MARHTGYNPDTAAPGVIHLHIKTDRECYLPAGENVQLYRDYCEGNHKVGITEEMAEILEGLTANKKCENVCHKIVAEARDRLTFLGWTCENTAVQERLADLYTAERI